MKEAREEVEKVLANKYVHVLLDGTIFAFFTDVLDDLGMKEERERLARQVARSEGLDWWKQLDLVQGLRVNKKYEDALSVAERVLAKWPQFHFGHEEHATILYEMHRFEEAEQAAAMALSIMHRNPKILSTHGKMLLSRGAVENGLSRQYMAIKMGNGNVHALALGAMYGRPTKWTGFTLEFIRSWYHRFKANIYLGRSYLRQSLENKLTQVVVGCYKKVKWNRVINVYS